MTFIAVWSHKSTRVNFTPTIGAKTRTFRIGFDANRQPVWTATYFLAKKAHATNASAVDKNCNWKRVVPKEKGRRILSRGRGEGWGWSGDLRRAWCGTHRFPLGLLSIQGSFQRKEVTEKEVTDGTITYEL